MLAPDVPQPATGRRPPVPGAGRAAHRALLVVCAVFLVASLVLVPPGLALGWDEIVYATQFAGHADPAVFSAPRSRGVPLLTAPVVAWTSSTVLLRCWLALAAAAALYLGYRPWLRLMPGRWTVPAAAAAYATLWITLFYGGAAMPNHYVAMAAVAAAGALLAGGRMLAPAVAVAALMRPNDAAWLAGALLVAVVAVPREARAPRALAVAGGAAAGVLPWAVEAWVNFGGLRERVHRASEIQGGTGWTFSLPEYVSALDGPLLCRPCALDPTRWPAVMWWPVLAVCVLLGVRAAHRAGRPALAWLPVGVAAAMSFTYLFLVAYAAPRFLLPAYALLMLPAALGILATIAELPRQARKFVVVVVVAGLTAHVAGQALIAHRHAGVQAKARADWRRVADVLHAHGVRPPCRVTGTDSVPVAYTARCASADPGGNNATTTLPDLLARAAVVPTALVLRGGPVPSWARDWRPYEVPGTYKPGWTVHVAPRTGTADGPPPGG